MSKRDKLRQKLRKKPADSSMQDVETLLMRFGFKLARTTGSHHIYEYEADSIWKQIIIPLHGSKVKKVYVKKVVDILDELFPDDVQDDKEIVEEDSSDNEDN